MLGNPRRIEISPRGRRITLADPVRPRALVAWRPVRITGDRGTIGR
jgi:hypothetical protein